MQANTRQSDRATFRARQTVSPAFRPVVKAQVSTLGPDPKATQPRRPRVSFFAWCDARGIRPSDRAMHAREFQAWTRRRLFGTGTTIVTTAVVCG